MQFPAFRSEEWMREVAFAPLTNKAVTAHSPGRSARGSSSSSAPSDSGRSSSTGGSAGGGGGEARGESLGSSRDAYSSSGSSRSSGSSVEESLAVESGRTGESRGAGGAPNRGAATAATPPAGSGRKDTREVPATAEDIYRSQGPLFPPDFCFANLELLPPYLSSFPTAALYRERIHQVQRSIKRALFRQSLFKIQNVEVLEFRRCPAPRRLLCSEVVYDLAAAQEEQRQQQQRQQKNHVTRQKQQQDQQQRSAVFLARDFLVQKTQPVTTTDAAAVPDAPGDAAAETGRAAFSSASGAFRSQTSDSTVKPSSESTVSGAAAAAPAEGSSASVSSVYSTFSSLLGLPRLFASASCSSAAGGTEDAAGRRQLQEQQWQQKATKQDRQLQQDHLLHMEKSQQQTQAQPQEEQQQGEQQEGVWKRMRRRWAVDDSASPDRQVLLREEIWTVDRCSSLRKYRVQVYQAAENAKQESPAAAGDKVAGQQQIRNRGDFYSVTVEPLAYSDRLRQFYFYWRDSRLSSGSAGAARM